MKPFRPTQPSIREIRAARCLNARGQVIGINTMILTGGVEQSAGIGFAIPINTAKAVLDDLVHLGRVRRPEMGVRTIPIGRELADQLGLAADSGLLIVEVVPGSAADHAGILAVRNGQFWGQHSYYDWWRFAGGH